MVSPTLGDVGSLFMNSSGDVGLRRPSQSGTWPASGDTRAGGVEDDMGLSRVDIASRVDDHRVELVVGTTTTDEEERDEGENAMALAQSVSTRAAACTFIVSP